MTSDEADDGPLDELAGAPVDFGDVRSSVLTPEGTIESVGSFSRSFGSRRLKILIFGAGVFVVALALLSELT